MALLLQATDWTQEHFKEISKHFKFGESLCN